MYFRYCFLLLLSVFTLINLTTVYAHLRELDEQVTYRIRTYSNAVLARTASQAEKMQGGKPVAVASSSVFQLYKAPTH